jgi:hypothetical protein
MAMQKQTPSELSAMDPQSAYGARPRTDTSPAVQIILALLGTALVGGAAYFLKGGKLDFIFELVNHHGPVQYIELFMFFMLVAQVVLKSRLVKEQFRVVTDNPIDPTMDYGSDSQIDVLRAGISAHPAFGRSILLGRVERILSIWKATKSADRVSTWSAAESERAAAAADTSYSLARALIWAIPILGFIGTVQGLGKSVSGFAASVAGSSEMAQIRQSIGSMTDSLGTAFDTTYLALILVALVMFPLVNVQRREENLLVEIDTYLDDALISRLPVSKDVR